MLCTDNPAPIFLIISSVTPQILYYSHIPATIIALFLGIFVYLSDKGRSLASKLLLFISIAFAVWSILDLILWTNIDSNLMIFSWSIVNLTEMLVSASTLYFSYVFLSKKDLPFKAKLFYSSLLLIFAGFITTRFNVPAFDIPNCEASQGPLINYFYALEALFFVSLIIYLIKKIITAKKEERKMTILFSIGVTFFLASFSGANVAGSITGNWQIIQYGLFGMPVFMAFLAYLIIQYKVFNIKLLSAQALVIGMAILVGSQFFFIQNNTNKVLTGITLVLISIFGWWLAASVKKEVEQKEKLQELSTQLSEANIHLKDLDKMKTEFVSLASHELLTPVSAIEGYLSMMLDEKLVTLEDPKAVQYMDRVYRSSKRLARLIADMLNISRIEEGRLLVEKKDVDMVELINQVLEELKFKAEEHKQKMVFTNNEFESENKILASAKLITNNKSVPSSFLTFADPDKIKEVLVNLMGNSIKYTLEPGTITVTIEKVPTKTLTDQWGKLEAQILARPVDDQESIHAVGDDHLKQIIGTEQYLIKVKDEGVGIPKEELPKLFKKFHRVGNFSTQESQGTGLGLYITRALVELHHGRVWPDSEGMGKGSTFTFSLPTIESKQAIIDLEAQSPNAKEQLKPLAKPMGNDDAL